MVAVEGVIRCCGNGVVTKGGLSRTTRQKGVESPVAEPPRKDVHLQWLTGWRVKVVFT